MHVNDPVNCLSLDANAHTLDVSIVANATAASNDKPGTIENIFYFCLNESVKTIDVVAVSITDELLIEWEAEVATLCKTCLSITEDVKAINYILECSETHADPRPNIELSRKDDLVMPQLSQTPPTKSSALPLKVSVCRSTRRLLWEELVNFSTSNVPWLVGGDINTILHFDGNQDGSLNKMGPMEDFNDMVMECNLTDVKFRREPFTWTNRRIWKRLNRVLYSKEWMDLFNCT
ncbi:UNVERIFIED_CONTAM: hypothetical protein Scaly_2202900 [Sesamum calycinum]|uniref:Uncharacterized protein n=1 Tax=Sesamum calycinum TaxID=2727403 RepID=A0AAW2MNH9_9LAMI